MEAVEDKVCFNPKGFKALLMTLQDTYKSAGSAMIFQMSQRYGEHLISELYPLSEDEYSDLLGAIDKRLRHVRNLGWGEFKVKGFDPDEEVIKIQCKSPVLNIDCRGETEPMCIFIKGALVGAVNSILKKDFMISMEEYVDNEDKCKFVLETR